MRWLADFEDAQQRVAEFLRQRDAMRGQDPEILHSCNGAPLLIADLRLLATGARL